MNGKLGKKQLSSNRMEELKRAAFEQYPLEGFEKEKNAWADCVRAIDESGRELKKKKHS